ncbi:MAG: hypothetical protein AAGC53_09940 [Actinomycetota bacterium]
MTTTLIDLADDLIQRGGVLLRLEGSPVRLGPIATVPLDLLGVRFGPAVDAVAMTVGPSGPVLAVDRTGEAVLVDANETVPEAAPPPSAGALLLDVARRSLGLATAPPDRPVADLVDTVWLDRALRCTLDAPLGEPPGWLALARLHPCGDARTPASCELLHYRRSCSPTWAALRTQVLDGVTAWTPVSPSLAAWFDPGSFARHAFAVLPEPSAALADLHDLLRPVDAERIARTVGLSAHW